MHVMSEVRSSMSLGRPSNKRLDTAEAGRTCAEDNCETILSRYNKTDRCGVHDPTLAAPAMRNSK
jgi:hypothetical protein